MSEPTSDPNPNPDQIRDPETGKVNKKELWYKVRSGLAVALSLVVLLGGGFFLFGKAQAAWMDYRTAEDYLGEGGDPVVVVIPKGATVTKIGQILVEADVVKSTKAFNKAAQASPASIQAGQYNLRKKLPAQTALSMLLDRANLVRNWLLLKDGKTIKDQIPVMSKATGIPAAEFRKAYANWKDLRLPAWATGLEGFLMPDKYELPDKPTAAKVIKLATAQFDVVAGEVGLKDAEQSTGYSPYQVLIVASIVEKEVGNSQDRAKVARVLYNRLQAGTPLGVDSPIAYAVGKSGQLELSSADLKVKSPYNTRTHKGLPPGPISNPGKAALDAALHPAEGDWIYFVTVNPSTGETLFTSDYAEFQRGKEKYKAWCDQSAENKKACYGG